MAKIIGICGLIGSGKDTAADYLVNFHEFRRDSFAASLKDAVAAVFGWDRELLEGRTKQAREWREQVDLWWAKRLGLPNLTPRWVLQQWGTEVCRQAFHDDIWIASLEHRLLTSQDRIVISDCRFPNEIKAIRQAGGQVIWVQRGQIPDWCETLISMKNNGASLGIRANYMQQFNVHASEWAWIGTDFDYIIDNNGTVEQLYQQLLGIVQ